MRYSHLCWNIPFWGVGQKLLLVRVSKGSGEQRKEVSMSQARNRSSMRAVPPPPALVRPGQSHQLFSAITTGY